jgi:hypothetical protein
MKRGTLKIDTVILCSFLLFSLPLFARENTDVIIMKNGDHLTGQIKGLDAGVLYVGLPYVIQTLSVDWSQVVHLKSKQLFLVKTQDGSVYKKLYEDFAVLKDGRYGCPRNFNQLTPAWYLNNSNSPNVRCDDHYDFFALRDIKEG